MVEERGISSEECRLILDLVRRRNWEHMENLPAAAKLAPIASEYLLEDESWESVSPETKGLCIEKLVRKSILEDLKAPEIKGVPDSEIYITLKGYYIDKLTHKNVMKRLDVSDDRYYRVVRPGAFERLSMLWREQLHNQQIREEQETPVDNRPSSGTRPGIHLPMPRCRHLWGRESEIQSVGDILASDNASQFVGLFAFGGFGKTELARAIAERLISGGAIHDVVWLSFKTEEFVLDSGSERQGRNPRRSSVEEVMNSLALQLGTSLSQLPRVLAEERILIVLDNMETAPAPQTLLREIANVMGQSRVIITSRRRYSAPLIRDFDLSGLNRSDTFGLLQSEGSERNRSQIANATEATLENIFRVTRGAPLALHLIIAQTAFLDLERVLNALKSARGPSRMFYSFLLQDAWARLTTDARKLLIYMGATGNAGMAYEELEEAQLMEPDQVDTSLIQLAEWSLVEVTESPGGRIKLYDLHPLTRSFVRSDLRDEWVDQWEDYARRAVRSRLQRLRNTTRERHQR